MEITAATEEETAEKEIEVTPEMIEAGKDILWEFDAGWSDASQYAEKIYIAMESVRSEYHELKNQQAS